MCPYTSCTRIGQLGTVLSTIVLLVWAVVSVSLIKYRSHGQNWRERRRFRRREHLLVGGGTGRYEQSTTQGTECTKSRF